MTKISKKREEKIKEEVLGLLYENIKGMSTYNIGEEILRDDEFVLRLLEEMEEKGVVKQVKKNTKGKEYKARRMWALSKEAFEAYEKLL